MEDKKVWNLDKLKELGIEDLESVAGGVRPEDLSQEDRSYYNTITAKLMKAMEDRRAGKISHEQYMEIVEEWETFKKMCEYKYGK